MAIKINGTTILDDSRNLVGGADVAGITLTSRRATNQDGVIVTGRSGGTSNYAVTITPTTLTADRTLTLANGNTTLQAGTMAVTGSGLNQFASTTSAQLAGIISDETGSGSLVFGTSPTFTTGINAASTTMALFDTTATTVNAFGDTTTLNLGYDSTATSTTNLSIGSTASGNTKTVNIGTGGASGSTTNINIGDADGGSTKILSPSTVIPGNLSIGQDILATSGPITTLTRLTGGTGYMNGIHTNVALTGGTGSYALATVDVSGGIVQIITLTWGGHRYSALDTLTVPSLATTLATTAASGNGTTATLTFTAQSTAPFQVGSQIIVAGVTPTGYNGTYTVTGCTTTTVSYANTTTGAQTVAGTVKMGTPLTNSTAEATAIQGSDVYVSSNISNSIGARIRLESNDTTLAAGQEYGAIVFGSRDAGVQGSGDVGIIRGISAGVNGGSQIEFWTGANATAPTRSAVITSGGNFRLYDTTGTYYNEISNAPTANRVYTLPDVGSNASFVLTAGEQTISGTKTFSGDLVIADKIVHSGDADTAIRFSSTDVVDVETAGVLRLRVSGTTIILPGATTETRGLEIGVGRTGDGFNYIDLVGDTTYGDFGTRLSRSGGATGQTNLIHRGTGDLRLVTQDAGEIVFVTNNTEKLRVDSDGNVGIGVLDPGQKLDITGSVRASSQFISTVAAGTAPLAVSSTTAVTNLNADLLDDIHASSFLRSDANNTAATGGISTSGAYVEAGRNSGSVALTVNDGGGNANVTFNHRSQLPDQTGNAGRIAVNTDSTTNASMTFGLKSGVTADVSATTTNILTLVETGATLQGNFILGTQTNKATITYTTNTSRTYTLPDAGANADFVMTAGSQTIGGSKTFSSPILTSYAPTANTYTGFGNGISVSAPGYPAGTSVVASFVSSNNRGLQFATNSDSIAQPLQFRKIHTGYTDGVSAWVDVVDTVTNQTIGGNKTFTSTISGTISNATGAESLAAPGAGAASVTPIGGINAVNRLTVTASDSGQPVLISTVGPDTNVNLEIKTQSNGAITIDTGTGTGEINLKPGASNVRIWDDNSSHYYQIVTGNRTANYDITLPAGSVTLVTGTMVATTRTLTGANGIDTIGNLSANRTIQLTGQALALHNLATNGLITRTGSGTVAARTITAGTVGGVLITDGDGVAGNPTIQVPAYSFTSSDFDVSVSQLSGQTPSNTISMNKIITAAYKVTSNNDGTKSSGTYTPALSSGSNMKYITNGGAFTLAAPTDSGDFTMLIQITNNSTAGAITMSNFTRVTGSPFTTTNTHKFIIHITKLNSFTHAHVVALQ